MGKTHSLTELIAGCIEQMERLQYAPLTIRNFKTRSKEFQAFVAQTCATDIFSEDLAASFLKQKYHYPPESKEVRLGSIALAAIRCVHRLGEYATIRCFVQMPRSKAVKSDWYLHDIAVVGPYLKSVNKSNKSDATKRLRTHHIKLFYEFMGFRGLKHIHEVTPTIFSDYALSLQGGSLVYAKHRLASLRFFLRFLHSNGLIAQDMSYAVPHIKIPLHKNIPALWKEEDLRKILTNIDRGSPAGKRDYAVLLLVINLGIRASDVASLKLEHLKWDRRQIEFPQHKTGSVAIFPLSDELGWAIIDYLRHGRPKTEEPYVFMKNIAPYTKLLSGSVSCIIARHMFRTGIPRKPGTVSGMHSLRHALARKLLANDVPLNVISTIMGHTSIVSASPYLKVDIDGLKECAISIDEVLL